MALFRQICHIHTQVCDHNDGKRALSVTTAIFVLQINYWCTIRVNAMLEMLLSIACICNETFADFWSPHHAAGGGYRGNSKAESRATQVCNFPDTFFWEFPRMAAGTSHAHAMYTAHSERKQVWKRAHCVTTTANWTVC